MMDHSTALIWASREGSVEALKALIEARADVNAQECSLDANGSGECHPALRALGVADSTEVKRILRLAGARP